MKVQIANRSEEKLSLWIEPNPDEYMLNPGEEVVVEGRLEHTADGALCVDWWGTDITLYDDCTERNEVVVTKHGSRLKPDNSRT